MALVNSARQLLFRHPSFWNENEPELLLDQVMEDPRVIASEKWVYNSIASQTTAFVATLDELTINCGFCLENGPFNAGFENGKNNCFRRVVSHPSGETSGELYTLLCIIFSIYLHWRRGGTRIKPPFACSIARLSCIQQCYRRTMYMGYLLS
jgi:hypothetical protein